MWFQNRRMKWKRGRTNKFGSSGGVGNKLGQSGNNFGYLGPNDSFGQCGDRMSRKSGSKPHDDCMGFGMKEESDDYDDNSESENDGDETKDDDEDDEEDDEDESDQDLIK